MYHYVLLCYDDKLLSNTVDDSVTTSQYNSNIYRYGRVY